MQLSELKALHVSALLDMAGGLEIDNANRMRKQELMFAILKKRAKSGEQFSVVFSRVKGDGGEQTRVRMESGTADHKDIVFSLLAKLDESKAR